MNVPLYGVVAAVLILFVTLFGLGTIFKIVIVLLVLVAGYIKLTIKTIIKPFIILVLSFYFYLSLSLSVSQYLDVNLRTICYRYRRTVQKSERKFVQKN